MLTQRLPRLSHRRSHPDASHNGLIPAMARTAMTLVVLLCALAGQPSLAMAQADDIWLFGELVNGQTGNYYHAGSGIAAYCYDPGKSGPDTSGNVYYRAGTPRSTIGVPNGEINDRGYIQGVVGYICYHGYPRSASFGGETFDTSSSLETLNARIAVNAAIWAYRQGWNDVSSLVGNPKARRASQRLLDDAKAWAATSANNWLAHENNSTTVYVYPDNPGNRQWMLVPGNPEFGHLELFKTSTNLAAVEGNPLYSCAGAEYGVYRNQACTDKYGTLVTDDTAGANHAGMVFLPVGTYFVREDKPSRGYTKDTYVYAVNVEADTITRVGVRSPDQWNEEIPKRAKISIIARKVDAETGQQVPQGNGSLEGAEFTVGFYRDHLYDKTRLPRVPYRTWILRTDADGVAAFDTAHKVGGDSFFTDAGGNPFIPLGTISVTETKAPAGYRLPTDPIVNLYQIKDDQGSSAYVYTASYDADVADEPKRGGLAVMKVDQHGEPLEGAEFAIYNRSQHAVLVEGILCEPSDEIPCLTIVSGADGIAQTDANALPVGTYEVRETAAPEGYERDETWSKSAVIADDGDWVDLTDDPVTNRKTTWLTASAIPHAHKTLRRDGTVQQLADGQFTFVLLDDEETEISRATCKADGSVTFAPLEYDQDAAGLSFLYFIREVAGNDPDTTYDQHTETLTVSVELSADESELIATPHYDRDGANFVNDETPPTGEVTLVAAKRLQCEGEDVPIEDREFSFTLLAEDGTEIQSQTCTADGSVTFDAIHYTKADIGKTFTYLIREVPLDDPETTYDDHDEHVSVSVEREGSRIKATASYDQDGATFLNTRTVRKTSLPITGKSGFNSLWPLPPIVLGTSCLLIRNGRKSQLVLRLLRGRPHAH